LLGSLLSGFVALARAETSETLQSKHEALLKACTQSLACHSHVERANQLYEQNAFDAARDEYQAAYVLQPYPLILYNIARIHHKQSHLSDAIAYYQRYLSTGHAERAERARQLLSEAKQVLQQQDAEVEPPPAPLRPEPPPLLISAKAPSAEKSTKPMHKKWWLWTLVGVAAVGAATAIGIGVYASGPDVSGVPSYNAMLGN
jgi:tetratricopeptide (TPR) repeat protein